jgi:predicted metal-dependent phosphoesterase TrpH
MIDLHIHSVYSDGQWTPEEILTDAQKKKLAAIAITDHDAIQGYQEAKKLAPSDLNVISGIELNTDGVFGELHILGYNFDPEHPSLQGHISWRSQERKDWGKKMIERLNDFGYAISYEKCLERVGKGVLVRTHIAEELAASGYFPDWKEAHQALLKKGKPGFVERCPFSAVNAIDLIHEAGGEAFLAHPGIYSIPFPLEELVAAGLDGIEVWHPKHSAADVEYWSNQAERFGMIVSGGSDFHGPSSRNPFPIGSVKIPEWPETAVRKFVMNY